MSIEEIYPICKIKSSSAFDENLCNSKGDYVRSLQDPDKELSISLSFSVSLSFFSLSLHLSTSLPLQSVTHTSPPLPPPISVSPVYSLIHSLSLFRTRSSSVLHSHYTIVSAAFINATLWLYSSNGKRNEINDLLPNARPI